MLLFRFANDTSSRLGRDGPQPPFAACTPASRRVLAAGQVSHIDSMRDPYSDLEINIGTLYADSSKFTRATDWAPTVTLRDGLCQTIAFYRRPFGQYVEASPTRESV
jgi:hypothetical protein